MFCTFENDLRVYLSFGGSIVKCEVCNCSTVTHPDRENNKTSRQGSLYSVQNI